MGFNKLSFIVFVLIFFISTVHFASAGFFDIFSKKDAELSPTPVTATLIVNTPPFISKIFPVPVGWGVPLQPIQPVAGTGAITFFETFVVEDLDIIGDIPSIPVVGTDFTGGIQSPASFSGSVIGVPFTSCITSPCSAIPGICPNPLKSLIYLCSGNNFLSWYPPSTSVTNPSQMWTVGLQIKDATTGIWGNLLSSGQNPQLSIIPDSYYQVNTVSGFSAAGNPTWQSLPTTATNQISSQQVVFTNQGNVALPTVSITGTPLVGNAGPTSLISETAFKVSSNSVTVCTSGTVLTASNSPIIGAAVPYTGAGLGIDILNLAFCVAPGNPLSTYQSGPASTTYTNAANPWIVNAI